VFTGRLSVILLIFKGIVHPIYSHVVFYSKPCIDAFLILWNTHKKKMVGNQTVLVTTYIHYMAKKEFSQNIFFYVPQKKK